nr:hypothetical protein [Haliscomenobacter sp.]
MKQAHDKAKDRELAQAKEIEKAYTELRSTQVQLIQSEKLASLGNSPQALPMKFKTR